MIVKVENNNVHGSTIFSLINIVNIEEIEAEPGPPPLMKINNSTLVHSFQMHYYL
jgi:hypothetical protein